VVVVHEVEGAQCEAERVAAVVVVEAVGVASFQGVDAVGECASRVGGGELAEGESPAELLCARGPGWCGAGCGCGVEVLLGLFGGPPVLLLRAEQVGEVGVGGLAESEPERGAGEAGDGDEVFPGLRAGAARRVRTPAGR
jgi:hypothetical protein